MTSEVVTTGGRELAQGPTVGALEFTGEQRQMIRAGALREADRRDAAWMRRREALSPLVHVETRVDQGRELRVMRVARTGRYRTLPFIPWLHRTLTLASQRAAPVLDLPTRTEIDAWVNDRRDELLASLDCYSPRPAAPVPAAMGDA